jgi:histone H3/H4
MPPPAKYPRATVRKIIKGHSQKRVSRDVDALVYLDYVLFMEEYV